MKAIADFQRFFKRQNAPVTMGLICAIVGVSILLFLLHSNGESWVITAESIRKPWVFLTYPFVEPMTGGFGVITLIFLAYWLFWIGSSLERDLGSLRMGIVWLTADILCALCVVLGAIIGHASPYWVVGGSILPISALTVIWGIRNKTACIRLMMCIPITGYWLAWLTIAIVLVDYGQQNLAIGVLACLPMALAWAFAANRIPKLAYGKPAAAPYKPSKAQLQKEAIYFDDVRKREQERDERERLRKLFEGSLDDSK